MMWVKLDGENQLYVDTDILPSVVAIGAALQYYAPKRIESIISTLTARIEALENNNGG